MNRLRADLAIVADWLEPGSRVLDLGCGDGTLLRHLADSRDVTGYGVEINQRKVAQCLRRDVEVIQIDLDKGLTVFDDDSFDYVVLSQTIQAVHHPDRLLDEMLRVGRQGIVTFPNFGYWRLRFYLTLIGRMPKSPSLPNAWYNTPNIHLCTLADFEGLCRSKGIRVLERRVVDHAHRENPLIRALPNLLGEIALYRFERGG